MSQTQFQGIGQNCHLKIQEQETRKMDGRIGKLLLHVFSYLFYVAIKVKLCFVQVAKSRSYVSWSQDLKGHVDVCAI